MNSRLTINQNRTSNIVISIIINQKISVVIVQVVIDKSIVFIHISIIINQNTILFVIYFVIDSEIEFDDSHVINQKLIITSKIEFDDSHIVNQKLIVISNNVNQETIFEIFKKNSIVSNTSSIKKKITRNIAISKTKKIVTKRLLRKRTKRSKQCKYFFILFCDIY